MAQLFPGALNLRPMHVKLPLEATKAKVLSALASLPEAVKNKNKGVSFAFFFLPSTHWDTLPSEKDKWS